MQIVIKDGQVLGVRTRQLDRKAVSRRGLRI
jgi:hypothetical protein